MFTYKALHQLFYVWQYSAKMPWFEKIKHLRYVSYQGLETDRTHAVVTYRRDTRQRNIVRDGNNVRAVQFMMYILIFKQTDHKQRLDRTICFWCVYQPDSLLWARSICSLTWSGGQSAGITYDSCTVSLEEPLQHILKCIFLLEGLNINDLFSSKY